MDHDNAAVMRQAIVYQQEGKLREAAALCRQVLARDPDHAEALSVLGILSCQLGRKDLGMGFAGRAVQLQPNVAAYQHNYAETWLAMGETEQAIAAYRRAVDLAPGRPEPWAGLGVALHRRGFWRESASALRRAIDAGAVQPDTYVALAQSLLRCGQLDEAETYLQKAMDLKPSFAEAWQVRGEIQGHRQKYAEAVAAFTRAAELAPGNARPHHGAGVVLALQGDFAAASAAMGRALKLDPDYPEANCGTGAILLRVGRTVEAIGFYEKALLVNPGYLEARADLALAYEKAGRLKDAAAQYEVLADATSDAEFFRFQRASLGQAEAPPAAPSTLVARIFDRYARSFDEHLTKYLGYRAPQLIFQAVARAAPSDGLHILDLGCGTGLCGQLFKPLATQLVGVDLSPAMVEKARERGIYDKLIVADLLGAATALKQRFDLVTASDVFCYIGDLAPVFQMIAAMLRPAGIFAFTVEAITGDEPAEGGYILRQTRRYAHAASYLRQLIVGHGYELVCLEQAVLRSENRQDVQGFVVVLRGPRPHQDGSPMQIAGAGSPA